MSVTVDIKALLEAGVHFGHKTSRWHPKMAPYIHSKRQDSHIIDLTKTVEALDKALPELTKIAASGKKVLYISDEFGELVSDYCDAHQNEISNPKAKDELLDNMETAKKFNMAARQISVNIRSEIQASMARKIEELSLRYSEINFIIGGSNGVNEELKSYVDYKISFSLFTFPHQLMKLILSEQIYRWVSINKNIKYHK